MATVCGGSLSLMDAGVPLKAACAGIAMGLVVEGDKYAILTDIAGAEDHYGDMDFKVAGTRQGITALQMDIKVAGVSIAMMREALAQARKARLQILDIMDKTISSARPEISLYAPHLFMLKIPTDKIRDLIGPGGKKIRGIIEATGVKIDVMDDGKVHVFASNGKSAEDALKMIRDVTATAEIGKTYLGTVVRIAEFGAFVEIFPGTDGLLHISEIAEARIRAVRDELKEGDQVLVKVLAIEGNKIRLSRKAVLRDKQAAPKSEATTERNIRKRNSREGLAGIADSGKPNREAAIASLFYSVARADRAQALDRAPTSLQLLFDAVRSRDRCDRRGQSRWCCPPPARPAPTSAGAQIRSSHWRATQRRWPGDHRDVSVNRDVRAHAHHLAGMHDSDSRKWSRAPATRPAPASPEP